MLSGKVKKFCQVSNHQDTLKCHNKSHHLDINSSSMHSATVPSPHNVQIANLNNNKGAILPCPVPRCIWGFWQPVGLRIHTCSGKHTFAPTSLPQPKSAHFLQRFRPHLPVDTPVKSLRTEKISNIHSHSPLYSSNSDSSDDELTKPNDSPPEHNTTSAPTPSSIQPDAFLHVRSSPASHNSTSPSPTTPTSSSNEPSSTPSHTSTPSSASSSSDNQMDIDAPQTLDGLENLDSESIDHNRLHKDIDDDGVPFIQTYHPISMVYISLFFSP